MKTYLASMQWPLCNEPICVGTNKRKITRRAVSILRDEHGNGNVLRPAAGCSCPIVSNDILVEEIEAVA